MFTETMYSAILSRQQKNAAQVFCTDFGFVRAFPMKLESKAHEVLSFLFHRDGVHNVIDMDGSKAQNEGALRSKLRDVGFHIKKTEPHTKSSNMGADGVRELKRGVGRKIMRSGCPNLLWDDCIIMEAYVKAHNYLDIFGLEVQVPVSKVNLETMGISTIAEYAGYEWVQ
jgi:hypothetical protein